MSQEKGPHREEPDTQQEAASEQETEHREAEQKDEQPERPRQRRRKGLIIGGAVLGVLLLLTGGTVALVLALSPIGPGGETGGGGGLLGPSESYDEEYVSGEGTDRVAVLPIEGPIFPTELSIDNGLAPISSPDGLRDALEQAEEDESVVGVVLQVDSPGGTVVASDQMYEDLQEFVESSDKPVVVSMASSAASGGYYVSLPADEIFAEPATITGSLGVIFTLTDFSEAADSIGVEQNVIKSGEFKDIGSAFRDLTEEERDIFESLVEEDYDRFVEVIVAGTGLEEERVRELADGRIYSGRQAHELGLVDELGGLEEAADRARELAGVEEAQTVRYVETLPPPGLFPLLGLGRQERPSGIEELSELVEETGLTLESGIPYYIYVPGL